MPQQSSKSKFMFVNDTGQSQAFKVGARHDIRSFIRRRHLKEIHGTKSRRAEEEHTGRPLATVIVGGTLAVEFPTGSDTRSTLVSFCEACIGHGNTLKCNHRAKEKSQNMILEKHRLQKLLGPSPLEILGAGRVDPFLTYPIENPDSSLPELMDYGESCHLNSPYATFSNTHLSPTNRSLLGLQ